MLILKQFQIYGKLQGQCGEPQPTPLPWTPTAEPGGPGEVEKMDAPPAV